MRILILFQIFNLSWCDSIVREYLDAVAKFGNENIVSQHSSSRGGNQKSLSSTLNYVDKEHFLAFKKFKDNVNVINKDDNIPFTASINKFSIMTGPERELYTGLNVSMMEEKGPYHLSTSTGKLKALPKAIDWEKRGAQVAIKDQGACRGCWAFAAISAIEGGYFQLTGELESFSEQEILDCVYEWSRPRLYGCKDGGWPVRAYDYVQMSDRLASNKDAGFLKKDGPCRYGNVQNSLKKAKVVGNEKFTGDKGLKEAVAGGVASVALYISYSFHAYDKGVYEDPSACSGDANHAITVVGYGSSEGRNFWRVRNSWGSDWGENGYMKFSRDIPNHCSITKHVDRPIIKCRKPGACKNKNKDDDVKPKCENVWPDSYCNAAAYYCKREREGKEKEFQMKIKTNCKKSCRLCD